MEDLSALRLSLGVRSVRTAPGQAPPPEDDGLGAPSLAQEIYRKYAGKTQPESRQLVAILGAVQVRRVGDGRRRCCGRWQLVGCHSARRMEASCCCPGC